MIICPICNTQLDDSATYCTNCGVQFLLEDEPAQPQQQYNTPNGYAQQNYQPQNTYYANQTPPEKPKKKGGAVIAIVAAVAAIAVVAGVFLLGKGDQPQGGQPQGDNQGAVLDGQENATADPNKYYVLSGTDVFQGERYPQMLWGYYELQGYDYTGSFDDSAEFRSDMVYKTFSFDGTEKQVSALPISIHFGRQANFLSAFVYEGEYYNAYTELGRAMYRKAYMEQYGDISEEDFQKIEGILDLPIADVTAVLENGATVFLKFTYQIQGNLLSLYEVSVDDQYNVTIGEEPVLVYEFLHDGGKLTFACEGLQRSYVPNGYQAHDAYLTGSGYALNESNQYEDLEGFSFSRSTANNNEITVYPALAGDESPVDPQMTLDTNTGAFTLSWTQRWVYEGRNLAKADDPTTISGTYIPCSSYSFVDYEGFILIIDGKQYQYLMSSAEYDELRYSNLSDGSLSDSQLKDLYQANRNILEELEKAFRAAGISATVDYDKGQIALESSFLFATGSYELSADGQTYLDKFVDAYASVVFSDDYSDYISRIVVEGHTDTSGSYSYNLELSKNRANTVAQRCITRNAKMAEIVQAEGCSYDFPIYNNDGTVNMDASRRVTFRFVFEG